MKRLHLATLLLFVTILAACSTTEKAAVKKVSGVAKELPAEKIHTPVQNEIETVTTTKHFEIENIKDQDLDVSKVSAKAIESYQKEAAEGDRNAQYALGIKYRNGESVAQDYDKAREWFQKSATQGHAAAQTML